jgi:purine-binding chemotaxis protein CheW
MKRYLAFTVADLALAIQLDQVFEVVEVPLITKVPRPARHIEGLANLRGKTVPVVDLRKRLGLINPVTTSRSRMIVALPGGQGEPLGFIVDSVGEILSVGEAEGPARVTAPWVDERLLAGTLEVHGQPVLLADLVKILEND